MLNLIFIALATASAAPSASARGPVQEPLPDKPAWYAAWIDNLRWAVDESVRPIFNADGDLATLAFLGLDVHKVVSTGRRDLGTLTLQTYLSRVDGLDPAPGLFDSDEDWELVWRIFNANAKLRQDGALNLRVGHFELPYGLEHTLNTNGTLRDYTHGANFGLKADWGATLNGELDSFEYEFGWSRGSGNEYRSEGDPSVWSGRIGTPRDENWVLGLSVADGDFRSPGGVVTERTRVGLDALTYWRSLGFFGELSVGENGDGTDIARLLTEANWSNRQETLLTWCQLVGSRADSCAGERHGLESRLGLRWTWRPGWSASAQYTQVLDPFSDLAGRDGVLALQLRYRF